MHLFNYWTVWRMVRESIILKPQWPIDRRYWPGRADSASVADSNFFYPLDVMVTECVWIRTVGGCREGPFTPLVHVHLYSPFFPWEVHSVTMRTGLIDQTVTGNSTWAATHGIRPQMVPLNDMQRFKPLLYLLKFWRWRCWLQLEDAWSVLPGDRTQYVRISYVIFLGKIFPLQRTHIDLNIIFEEIFCSSVETSLSSTTITFSPIRSFSFFSTSKSS